MMATTATPEQIRYTQAVRRIRTAYHSNPIIRLVTLLLMPGMP